jgi:hypothetical protein
MVALSWLPEYKHSRNPIATSIDRSDSQHRLLFFRRGAKGTKFDGSKCEACFVAGTVRPVLVFGRRG